MLDGARLRVRSLLLRRRLEREMQDEMAEHLERAAARLVARGLSAEEARRAARREFGNVAFLQEQARDARGARWAEALAADLRFARRHLARTPLTTLTMLLVLVGGMTIAALLFSFVHSYAVQPPPGVARADDLVRIRGSRTAGVDGRGTRAFSADELREYQALGDQFRLVAGWTEARVPLVVDGGAERRTLEASVVFVTASYFPVLDVRPTLGPGLPTAAAEDPATAAVAVIGHAAWDRHFGRDPRVVGATVTVNGVRVTIVGVAPERFAGVGMAYSPLRLWMPLAARRLLLPDPSADFRAAGRLRPGVDRRTATAAAQAVAARAAAADPALRALAPATDVVPLLAANGDPMFERDVRLMTLLVGLLGLLVLLVACTNVSALLTGLAAARRQEIAVRLSLGAARGRLVRQLLTESALLAVVAGATALALVGLALRLVTRLVPAMPFDVGITWPATAFVFGVALAVGVLFGLSPALHGTRLAVASALRDSSASVVATRARLQRGLVVAQIAFTQPLIVLMTAVTLIVIGDYRPWREREVTDRLLAVTLRPASSVETGTTPAAAAARRRLRATMERVTERLRARPGVEAIAVDWSDERSLGAYVVHPGDRVPGVAQNAVRLSATPTAQGFLGLVGTPLRRGRDFAPADVAAAEAGAAGAGEVPIIVGTSLARRLWAAADPLGRRLRAASDSTPGARTLVVVGVIDDPLADRRQAGDEHPVHLPPDTTAMPRGLLLRTSGAARPVVPAVHELVRAEATNELVVGVRALADLEEEALRTRRLTAAGISAAGLVALLLSAIGLYAVVAFAVGQRTREIAVRMAVGAPGRQIVRRFVADGLRLSALGLVLGLPAGLLGVHLLLSADADFPEVSLGRVTVIAALGVVAVAVAAAWLPARRAAAVDPAVTLRSE